MSALTPLRVPGPEAPAQAYEKLRAAYRARPFPGAEEREDRLVRLEKLLVARRQDFVAAVSDDFGGRSSHETLLADVIAPLDSVRVALAHVRAWMKPWSVSPNRWFRPSKAYVEPMPKGVVGIISPWNYPVNLALGPLAGALAAGNRVLLKPSELTPRTSRLLADAVADTFSAEEVAVVEGGPEIARAVTKLPLDHLLFTGSTTVGKLVAAAAAEGLVPLTLELGGKSPALVHESYPVERAAERIAHGKLFNAGQTCIAPDYVLLPEGKERAFAGAFAAAVRRGYPRFAGYTSIVNDRQHARLLALLDDARARGARVEPVEPDGPPDGARKLSPTLVFAPTDEMKVMQEEIFGPLLPVRTYRDLDEAIAYVNERPRPLAFYYFDEKARRAEAVLSRVISGGACVNDTLVHFAQEELPFGGTGASGMGAYHGEAGFRTFSHERGVLVSSPLAPAAKLLAPPYGAAVDRAIELFVGKLGRWLS